MHTLSAKEFAEWQAYDRLDPIGAYRGDIQSAIIASATAGGKVSDYIVIDPNPMTDAQKQAAAQEAQKAQLQAQVMRTIAMFKSMR